MSLYSSSPFCGFIFYADEGFGVRELTGTLDLSNNFISDSDFLFVEELSQLSCVGELNLEYNLIEYISNVSIELELKSKWSSCGSSL